MLSFSGELNWGGKDFTESAENIELNFREDGLWLEADLVVGEGEGEDEEKQKERRGINLSERLMIKDGDLVAGV